MKGVSGGGSWVLKAWRGCARCHSNLLVSANQYSVTTLLGARRPAQSVIQAQLHPTNPHTRSYQDDFPPLVRFTDFPRFFKSESRPRWRAGGSSPGRGPCWRLTLRHVSNSISNCCRRRLHTLMHHFVKVYLAIYFFSYLLLCGLVYYARYLLD